MPRRSPGPLKPDRAFLVQLRPESDGRRRLSGRIEHVMSGASEQFSSLTALLDFMARFAGPTSTTTRNPSEE
jgi:hypothetical protein